MSSVISAIKNFPFKENEKHITVALSGGADSMALLTGLNMLKDELGITLSAVHLNHSLRGTESDRDEAFVKEQCSILGIPLICRKEDVKAYAAKENLSIELAARHIRYAFFSEVCEGAVATAHNSDDNLETVIYRLTRSTGLSGLCGIPVRRGIFIRPLLSCSREEIEDFCREYNVPFVTDSTNLTDEYTRNKIRHNILPVLKEINPSVLESFTKTASLLEQDRDFIQSVCETEYKSRTEDKKLKIVGFEKLPTAVSSRVISLFLENSFEDSGYYSINGVLDIISKGQGRFQLPGGKMITVKNGLLFFEETVELPCFETKIIKEPVENIKENGKIHNLLLKNSIDCDKIVGKLTLRTRLPGDTITFLHRKVSKPLRKWMNEEGIEQHIRDVLPVIADDMGVVWVYGGGVDKRVCPDQNTKQIYHIFSKKLGGK